MKSQCRSQIAFVGASGSGKTTLIEALIPRLRQLGLAVGVVKYTHHHVEWDSPGKDSFRFQAAGASRVILKTPQLFLSEGPASGGPPLDEFLEGLDLVIHEGDRQSEIDKLIVGESLDDALQGHAGPDSGPDRRLARAGPGCFDRNDVEAVAAFVLQRVRPPEGSAAAFTYSSSAPWRPMAISVRARSLASAWRCVACRSWACRFRPHASVLSPSWRRTGVPRTPWHRKRLLSGQEVAEALRLRQDGGVLPRPGDGRGCKGRRPGRFTRIAGRYATAGEDATRLRRGPTGSCPTASSYGPAEIAEAAGGGPAGTAAQSRGLQSMRRARQR